MRRRVEAIVLCVATVAYVPAAFALSTDRDQPMDVKANYLRTDQNKNTNPDVSVTFLKGNVEITQGSIKAHGEEATIYQDSGDKSAKPAAEGAANSGNSKIKRVLLVGKQAHLQQVHDGDCSLMLADADTIDFHTDTDIADLRGHVTVVQKDKGEFHGEHMVYNTKTGEMESGDNSPESRVTMRFEPKSQQPQSQSSDNCGFPAGNSSKAKH
ncbi:MAG TPA: lipopolysaccharide transport periplasmic protein LptA [Rudaea sp.]|nr:lipopolysaccharide transport periplasmic protein LptA [Rudaea sp.]